MCYSTVGYLILFVIFALRTCSSLECYSCGSQLGMTGTMNNECEYFSYSSYEKYKQTHCPLPDSVCAKYVVDHDGTRWIYRACQRNDICSQLSMRYNDRRNMLLECDTCDDGNLCNSSPHYMSSFYYLTFLTVPLFTMK
ncbi:hypothetical protein JTB14_036833 [Gonioctena quinquepunctata]|nr:hypothetical protein JTB14_036833 [Gonioctena quinquepunctata]